MKKRHDIQMETMKQESEAALKRHLDLIDRLLADKDSLAKQVEDTKEQLADLQAKHNDTVAAMKAGWAQELKKQKDTWAAAEKVVFSIWNVFFGGIQATITSILHAAGQERRLASR